MTWEDPAFTSLPESTLEYLLLLDSEGGKRNQVTKSKLHAHAIHPLHPPNAIRFLANPTDGRPDSGLQVFPLKLSESTIAMLVRGALLLIAMRRAQKSVPIWKGGSSGKPEVTGLQGNDFLKRMCTSPCSSWLSLQRRACIFICFLMTFLSWDQVDTDDALDGLDRSKMPPWMTQLGRIMWSLIKEKTPSTHVLSFIYFVCGGWEYWAKSGDV